MAINLDKHMGFHHKAMDIRVQKMEVVAGNLANANTPGYKARDIDFQKAMQSAMADQSFRGSSTSASTAAMSVTNDRHMTGRLSSSPGASPYEIEYRIPNQPDTGDGNTVEAQTERNEFLDNGLRYQASVEFLNSKIKGMKKALSSGGQG